MQPSKDVIYFLQLLIIQLSKEPRIPTTTIPNINHPRILRGSYRKRIQESFPQRHIPTPYILSELHPVPRTNPEVSVGFKILPAIFDCLPYSHSIPLSHPFCAPTPILLPVPRIPCSWIHVIATLTCVHIGYVIFISLFFNVFSFSFFFVMFFSWY